MVCLYYLSAGELFAEKGYVQPLEAILRVLHLFFASEYIGKRNCVGNGLNLVKIGKVRLSKVGQE